jgi:diguanylate cyclase (GGDEF)-like protein
VKSLPPPARILLHYSPHGRSAPIPSGVGVPGVNGVVEVTRGEELVQRVARTLSCGILLDGTAPSEETLGLCRAIKSDPFSSVLPVIVYVDGSADTEAAVKALEAGADEVLSTRAGDREYLLRMALALHRADRDVSVHPTTLLPGTVQIERDIAARLHAGGAFAVCYADLDHFKEFNDRYGYNHGDRVILVLSRILRDVVRALSPGGFVGHIGGDDFIFITPLEQFRACCEEVIGVFNELIPLQYTAEDRERGHFVGKDRRGESFQVPLMTLSIGVVTNEHRRFVHPAQVSELATEMKSYAKSFSGSIYVVDRRSD